MMFLSCPHRRTCTSIMSMYLVIRQGRISVNDGMATSRNCTGEQDQNMCMNGCQIPIDPAYSEPNKMVKTEIGV